MKNYCILKREGSEEIKPSLQVMANQKFVVIIWCDRTFTFTPELDYKLEELSYFIQISEMFYSFYNNIKN